ncbi:MAG TPA: inositol monophosphatase [Jatrophihabitans sp.]|nr:inositol monophosphatase [Jatrophihabitans sp.]
MATRTEDRLNAYLHFAMDLAVRAGDLIRHLRAHPLEVRRKADSSPVTAIDLAVNQLVIETVSRTFPTHGILGEELAFGSGAESHIWVCDPVDGTKALILGIPGSVFMLALVVDGVTALSVVYDPHGDTLYHAVSGGGAFRNHVAMEVSNAGLANGFVVLATDAYPYVPSILTNGGDVQPVPGNGYKCMLVARGDAVGTLKKSPQFHDITPASLIVREAGGMVTGFDGTALPPLGPITGGVVISNRACHEALCEIALAQP